MARPRSTLKPLATRERMLRYLLLTGEPAPALWCAQLAKRGDTLAVVCALDHLTVGCFQQTHPGLPVHQLARPEDVQVPAQCDAVLISGADSRLFAAARQLGQTGLPLLILTTESGPTSSLFDLISLWEEGRSLLVPGFTSGLEQVTRQLSVPGVPERIEFERRVPSSGTRHLLSEAEVHRWFFQDARWLTELATRSAADPTASWENVQAIWTGQRDCELAQGMVTLTGQSLPETNWIIRGSSDAPGWKLTLWIDTTPLTLTSTEHPDGLEHDAAATLKQFAAAVEGSPDQTWNDVLRCGHLLAAVQRSAQRQRKVPVHFEEVSERSQFKTQMSTIGCGVLLWAMFGMIFMLAVAGTLDPRDRELRSAQAAGFVFEQEDFRLPLGGFSDSGSDHFQKIRDTWNSTTAPIIINSTDVAPETVQQQLDYIQSNLDHMELKGSDSRVIARPITGRWFEWLVTIGWCAVFGPLGIFLLMQLFLSVSHPGRQEMHEAATST